MFFCDYPIIRSEKQLPVYLVNMGQQHSRIILSAPRDIHIIRYFTAQRAAERLYATGEKLTFRPIPLYSCLQIIPMNITPRKMCGISTG